MAKSDSKGRLGSLLWVTLSLQASIVSLAGVVHKWTAWVIRCILHALVSCVLAISSYVDGLHQEKKHDVHGRCSSVVPNLQVSRELRATLKTVSEFTIGGLHGGLKRFSSWCMCLSSHFIGWRTRTSRSRSKDGMKNGVEEEEPAEFK